MKDRTEAQWRQQVADAPRQGPRSGRQHPYSCYTPRRGASARLWAALGRLLLWAVALGALAAAAWGWHEMDKPVKEPPARLVLV